MQPLHDLHLTRGKFRSGYEYFEGHSRFLTDRFVQSVFLSARANKSPNGTVPFVKWEGGYAGTNVRLDMTSKPMLRGSRNAVIPAYPVLVGEEAVGFRSGERKVSVSILSKPLFCSDFRVIP